MVRVNEKERKRGDRQKERERERETDREREGRVFGVIRRGLGMYRSQYLLQCVSEYA